MEVQAGGAAIRAEVAALRESARRLGWDAVRRGEWFDPWMRPPLLEGAPRADGTDRLQSVESRIRVAQARMASAATGELDRQPVDVIEDAVSGSLEDVPEALYRAAGRAIFVAREQVLLLRDVLALSGRAPAQDRLPGCWELLAAVVGVTDDDFDSDEDAPASSGSSLAGGSAWAGGGEAASPPPLPPSPSAPFGLQRQSLELARGLGARIIRQAVWQTAVAHVGRAVWAGWNDLAARQIAALAQVMARGDDEVPTALNKARHDFEVAARLIILGMWSMAVSDSSLHHTELDAIDNLCAALDIPGDWMGRLRSRSDLVASEFLNELDRLGQPEARKLVHDAVITAALADGRLEGPEMEYLRKISERLGEPFNEEVMQTRLAALHGAS